VGFSISPDSKLLAFLAEKGAGDISTANVALVSLDAGPKAPRRMLEPDPRISGVPRFTSDGKAVVYPILENQTENLWLQPLNGSRGHQITNFKSDGVKIFDYSPDGKHLGVLRYHVESDVVLLRDSGVPPR
jgi:Tol biopolymer transport system component